MEIHAPSTWQIRRHVDHAGAAMSVLCAVHCLLTPLLAGFYPALLRLLPGDAVFHRTLAVVIVVAGTAAFVPGYRIHRQMIPAVLAVLGIASTLAVAWYGDGLTRALELGVSIPGSMLLVAAHLTNRTFCRRCEACKDSPACQTMKP
jgi:hypothetical protein